MNVAVVSPPWFPVPPTAYGGTELVVHLLVEGLVERGVDVTLFASGDSSTSAGLASIYETAPSERIGESIWELAHVLSAVERAHEFDVVHDHSGVLGLHALAATGASVVHTLHGPLDPFVGALYVRACELARGCGWLTSLSLSQRGSYRELPWIGNVPNALDLDRYPLNAGPRDDYLLFLGRMCPEKGAHRAIDVARDAGMRLLIAAKCREPAERRYFERQVEPQLDDGVVYLGEASFEEKVALLRRARATLVPIEWDEPFGLVMVESAACGTPVLATRRGSVPEVVVDGVTGIVVDDHWDMAAALERASRLDPVSMRAEIEKRFSAQRMVEDYVDVYERAVAARSAARRRVSRARRATSPTVVRTGVAAPAASAGSLRARSVPGNGDGQG